jgi:CubicO group peptidase (beta-lactamase class C family)
MRSWIGYLDQQDPAAAIRARQRYECLQPYAGESDLPRLALAASALNEAPPSLYAQEKLLGPIGMTQSHMTKDRSGGTLMFMGLQSTCRDMARYGYLMLNNGKWKNTQVVPAAWVHDATGHSSQPGNAGYGYLWWLNRKGPIVDPLLAAVGKPGSEVTIGQMAPGAPADMYWAIGLGGQFIQVDPGSATVVVRLGPARAPDGAREFSQRDTADVVTQALTK